MSQMPASRPRWPTWLSPSARAGYAFGVTLVALPPLAIYSFESLAGLVVLAGLLSVNGESAARVRQWLLRAGPARMLALFAMWLIVSAAWAQTPLQSAQKALGISALWACGLFLTAAAEQLTAVQRRRCAWLFSGAILLMAAVYGLERATEGHFARWVKHIAPSAEIPEAAVAQVALVKIQRGVTALVCLLWAAGASAVLLVRNRWIGALLGLLAAGAIVIMPNFASVLALAVGAVVFAAALLMPRLAGILVTALFVVEALAFPWLVMWLPRGGGMDASAAALKFSAIHRLEIYRYVASLVAERPLLGYGFDAARALSRSAPKVVLPGFGQPVPLISLHPHNGALQIWLETGAVGALGLALFVALFGRSLLATPAPRPVKAAQWSTLAAVGTIASLSFGVWQYHWQSVIVIAVAVNALMVGLSRSSNSGTP